MNSVKTQKEILFQKFEYLINKVVKKYSGMADGFDKLYIDELLYHSKRLKHLDSLSEQINKDRDFYGIEDAIFQCLGILTQSLRYLIPDNPMVPGLTMDIWRVLHDLTGILLS